MDATFRAAIVISAIIHSVIFVPFHNAAVNPEKFNNKLLVVDYLKVKGPEAAFKKAARPDIESNKPIEMKAPVDANRENAKSAASKDEALKDAKKQAEIKSSKDYINYFQFLREKIRQRLRANYTYYDKEGDISLAFILESDGSLSAIEIIDAASAPDKELKAIAIESVKEAAPFPGFPKALPYPKLSFNLDISFKKQ